MEIDKEIKGQDLLSRLHELIYFVKVPSAKLKFYKLVQKVCLLNLENVDDESSHISYFKIDEELISEILIYISSIENIEIKARFYDILQINNRDKFINSKKAFELYFEVAKEGNLNSNRGYYIRSLEVLRQIKNGAKAQIILQYEDLKRVLLIQELGGSCYTINKIIQSYFNLSKSLDLDFNPFIEFINTGLLDLKGKNEYEKIRQCYGTLTMIDKEKD